MTPFQSKPIEKRLTEKANEGLIGIPGLGMFFFWEDLIRCNGEEELGIKYVAVLIGNTHGCSDMTYEHDDKRVVGRKDRLLAEFNQYCNWKISEW